MDLAEIDICSYVAPKASKGRRRSLRLKRLSVGSETECDSQQQPSVFHDDYLGSIWTDSPELPVVRTKHRKSLAKCALSPQIQEYTEESPTDSAFISTPEISRTCKNSPQNEAEHISLLEGLNVSLNVSSDSWRTNGSMSPCYDELPLRRLTSRRSTDSLPLIQTTTPLSLSVRSSADSTPYSAKRQHTRLSCDLPYSPSQPVDMTVISPYIYSPAESSGSVYNTPVATPKEVQSPRTKTPEGAVADKEEWFTCRKNLPENDEKETPKLRTARKSVQKVEILNREVSDSSTCQKQSSQSSWREKADDHFEPEKEINMFQDLQGGGHDTNYNIVNQEQKTRPKRGRQSKKNASSPKEVTKCRNSCASRHTSEHGICQNLFAKHVRRGRAKKISLTSEQNVVSESSICLMENSSTQKQHDSAMQSTLSKEARSLSSVEDLVDITLEKNVSNLNMDSSPKLHNMVQKKSLSPNGESELVKSLYSKPVTGGVNSPKQESSAEVQSEISNLTLEQLNQLDSYLGIMGEKMEKKKPRGRPKKTSARRKSGGPALAFEILVESDTGHTESSFEQLKGSTVDASKNQDSPDISQVVESICEDLELTRKTRRSQRNKRRSIEIYKKGTIAEVDSPDFPLENKAEDDHSRNALVDVTNQSSEIGEDSKTLTLKKTGRKRKGQPEMSIEDIYRNKNFKMPQEKLWETIYEESISMESSGSKTVVAKPNHQEVFSKRKLRRSICFESVAPAKVKKRIQRAVKMGWDPRQRKKRILSDNFVQSKILEMEQQLKDF